MTHDKSIAEYSSSYSRDANSNALISADTKQLEKFNKQKSALAKRDRELKVALDRINKLEYSIRELTQIVNDLVFLNSCNNSKLQ